MRVLASFPVSESCSKVEFAAGGRLIGIRLRHHMFGSNAFIHVCGTFCNVAYWIDVFVDKVLKDVNAM